MNYNSPLDRYCKSLKQLGVIEPMTDEETLDNFNTLRSIEQYLSQHTEGSVSPSDTRTIRIMELRKRKLVERITTSCLPYVLKLAKDFTHTSGDPDLLMELVAAGNEGLCKAVVKYKHDIGVPFRTYAANWMKANFRETLKGHQKVVKSRKGNAHTVYMDASPNDRHKYMGDQPDMSLENPPEYQNERVGVREELKNHNPMHQLIYRLRTGLCALGLSKTYEFTWLAQKLLLHGNTSTVKSRYKAVNSSIERTVFNISSKNDTSCDASTVQNT